MLTSSVKLKGALRIVTFLLSRFLREEGAIIRGVTMGRATVLGVRDRVRAIRRTYGTTRTRGTSKGGTSKRAKGLREGALVVTPTSLICG